MSCFEFYSSEFGIFIGIGTRGFEVTDGGEWKFWKYVEEAEFGPRLPVHTVFIMGKLLARDQNLLGLCVCVYIYIYICFINFFNYQIQV